MASELEPVGSMSAAKWGQVGIDFAVTPDGWVHVTVDLKGKHFIGVDFSEAEEEEFARLLVATSHTARVKRAELVDRATMPGQEDVEPPRDESDCRCGPNSERCPCEADGDDGLCSCCRNGDCNGRDAMPGQVSG